MKARADLLDTLRAVVRSVGRPAIRTHATSGSEDHDHRLARRRRAGQAGGKDLEGRGVQPIVRSNGQNPFPRPQHHRAVEIAVRVHVLIPTLIPHSRVPGAGRQRSDVLRRGVVANHELQVLVRLPKDAVDRARQPVEIVPDRDADTEPHGLVGVVWRTRRVHGSPLGEGTASKRPRSLPAANLWRQRRSGMGRPRR